MRSASFAASIRTSLVLGAALGTVVAASMMAPRRASPARRVVAATTDDGMVVTARLVTRQILPGAQEHNLAVTITAPNHVDLAMGRPPLSLAIVIDRSGSMHGPPIANAKAAAL